MSKRPQKSVLKIKSSDGDEFDVGDEVLKEMETLKSITTFGEDDDNDEGFIPTCPINGTTLKKVLVWAEYQNYFKQMSLKDTFSVIISADFLSNASLLGERHR